MRRLLSLVVLVAALAAALAVITAPASAVSCGDEFTGASGGEWSVAGNWAHGLPTSSTVVCWAAGKTVVIGGGSEEADSISAGGSLTLSGGSLKIAGASDASSLSGTLLLQGGILTVEDAASAAELKITGGTLDGSGTVSVSGAVKWVGEGGGFSGTVKLKQSGGSTFAVEGTGRFYFYGGSVETASPVTVGDPEFISADGPSLTTTSTLTLAPIEFNPNGSTSTVLSAKGILTTGNTVVQNFTLDATGGESKIEGGTLTVPVLNTSAGSTVNVAAGAAITSVGTAKIGGTIDGAGLYTEEGNSTTVEVGGLMSPGKLVLTSGTLATTSGSNGSPGSLTMDGGSLTGNGVLSVTGPIVWQSGSTGEDPTIKQAAGSTFMIEGTKRFYFYGGTVETASPISITNPEFITGLSDPRMTTTGVLSFGEGLLVPENGNHDGTFTAASVAANNGSSYGLGADALVLTGPGTTTVASGHTLKSGPLTVSGGVLQDDGTVEPGGGQMTLTGGTLKGTGVLTGSLTNTSGVVEPGDGAPGELYVSGEYKQEAGGTLAIRIKSFVPDTGYAQVQVRGQATFAGKLSLTDEDGYLPEPVHEFEVVKSEGGNSGAFSELAGPSADLYNVNYVTSGSFSGAWVAAKPPPAPVNTEAPKITGTPAAGQTLTCSTGIWTNSPTNYEYKWSLDGTPIGGAMEDEYEVPAGDEGHTLTCTVTASNAGGPGTPVTSEGVTVIDAPANTAPPAVSGTPVAGETLMCSTGTWSNSPTSYAYEWKLEGTPIAGATESTYTVQAADGGHSLTCVVTATNAAGSRSLSSEPVTVLSPPANTEAPSISGTPATGQTLTCSTGGWTASPTGYGYEWVLEGTPIVGATESTYTVSAADEGLKLTCVVTATNGAGKTAAKSQEVSVAVPVVPPVVAPVSTGPPVVTGIVGVGHTLSCSPGTWSGSPAIFEYLWNRENTPIAGATSSTYLVVLADVGHRLTCGVTASNGVRASSASTGVLVPAPPAPTPLPLQCSGKAIVLVSVRQVGRTVFLSGAALSKYAGQKVTITLSGVSKRLAKGKGGTAVVSANGTFEAKLAAPTGSGAGLTRYTATVAGSSSLALKLSRALKITGDTPVAGGARVSFQVTGALGKGKHQVTITHQLSCSKTVTYKKVALPKSGRFTLVLPASTTAGEVSYYRAQTHIAHGNTFSLPVPVATGS